MNKYNNILRGTIVTKFYRRLRTGYSMDQGTTDKLFFISADTDKVPISSTFLSADTDKKPIYFFPYRPIQIPITDISYFVI